MPKPKTTRRARVPRCGVAGSSGGGGMFALKRGPWQGAFMDGVFFWSMAVLAAMLVGMAKGGLPAVGLLSVPLLSLSISPVTAAGVLLPIYVVSDLFGLYAYRRDYDGRVVLIVMAGATVGVGIGWATASIVSERAVTVLVGVVGLAFAAYLLARRSGERTRKPGKVGPGLFWSTLAGFTSFVSHAGAPPYQVYVMPLGLPKAVFAGTATIAFAYVNAIKLVPYYLMGQFGPDNLRVAAMLVPVAVGSVFLGVRLVRVLPERLFFGLVTWALLIVSVKLIWDGVAGPSSAP